MRWLALILLICCSILPVAAQDTPTPAPTPTDTPTPPPWVYMTAEPPEGAEHGQLTRFDYVVTAGDVLIAVVLLGVLLSVWGFFVMWWIARR